MSEINLSALDNFSLSSVSGSGGGGNSWLSDAWGGFRGFLDDGISIAGDLTGLVNDWNMATGNNNNQNYTGQYQPTDGNSLADFNAQNQAILAAMQDSGKTWIEGVPNGAVMLGGAALLIGLIAIMGRK
jgi:hypothetical protein